MLPPASGLVANLGIELNPELLVLALTHRSFANEHGGLPTNERLEFLGDAVLGLAIAERLFREYPEKPEGELSAMRASIVSQRPLAEVGRELGISKYLLLGKGEHQTGGAGKDSILSDTVEALFGAAFLQHGFELARELAYRLLGSQIEAAGTAGAGSDWKATLTELALSLGHPIPEYVISWTGPDHARRFTAEVTVGGHTATGEGTAKKYAEQAAAEALYRTLIDRDA